MSNVIDAEKTPAADAPRETEAKKKPAKGGKHATKANDFAILIWPPFALLNWPTGPSPSVIEKRDLMISSLWIKM